MRPERSERPDYPKKERVIRPSDPGMQTFRIEVGHAHGVKPGNIVGAIANEANIDSKHIGRIEIYDDYSVLDLPESMSTELLDHLKTVWVAGQQLHIRPDGEEAKKPSKSAEKSVEKSAEKFAAASPRIPKDNSGARSVLADIVEKVERAERVERVEKAVTGKPLAAVAKTAAAEPALADISLPAAKKKAIDKPKSKTSIFRIEVGSNHAVTPNNIVGVIANEAGLEPKHVGRIEIFEKYSLLELPDGMPQEVLSHLKTVSLAGKKLGISEGGEMSPLPPPTPGKKATIGVKPKASGKFGDKPPMKKKADFSAKSSVIVRKGVKK